MKADAASAGTVTLSGLALWLHHANAWVAEHMPLFTAFGIISGAIMTGWYYWSLIKQRKRENDLKARELRRRHDDP